MRFTRADLDKRVTQELAKEMDSIVKECRRMNNSAFMAGIVVGGCVVAISLFIYQTVEYRDVAESFGSLVEACRPFVCPSERSN